LICIQNFVNLNFKSLDKMASHLETELGKLRGIIIKIGGLAENQVAEAKAVLSEPVLESKK
jgi:phosphate transport system protein